MQNGLEELQIYTVRLYPYIISVGPVVHIAAIFFHSYANILKIKRLKDTTSKVHVSIVRY